MDTTQTFGNNYLGSTSTQNVNASGTNLSNNMAYYNPSYQGHTQGTCPHCHRCPACGQQALPWYPYVGTPDYGPYPYYVGTTTGYQSNTGGFATGGLGQTFI